MKKVIVYCYNRCSTCKKAIKYLEENILNNNKNSKNIELELKDIITEKPDLKEMIKIIETKYNKNISEITRDELKVFFNTSGILYRENNIKDKIKDEKNSIDDILINILISDGKMIKRPLVIVKEGNKKDHILLGFKEEDYKNIF